MKSDKAVTLVIVLFMVLAVGATIWAFVQRQPLLPRYKMDAFALQSTDCPGRYLLEADFCKMSVAPHFLSVFALHTESKKRIHLNTMAVSADSECGVPDEYTIDLPPDAPRGRYKIYVESYIDDGDVKPRRERVLVHDLEL